MAQAFGLTKIYGSGPATVEEDNEILRRASIFFAGELDPRNL